MGSSAPVDCLRKLCSSFAAVLSGAIASGATTMVYSDRPSATMVAGCVGRPAMTRMSRQVYTVVSGRYSGWQSRIFL
jgi:hypothetical protein